MKAITVKNPWAFQIAYGEKRVENRSRRWKYTGEILIHAGKDDSNVQEHKDLNLMKFGAHIAVAHLAGCIHVDEVLSDAVHLRWPWVQKHIHATGPWLLILENVRRILPIHERGQLGLWNSQTLPSHMRFGTKYQACSKLEKSYLCGISESHGCELSECTNYRTCPDGRICANRCIGDDTQCLVIKYRENYGI